MRLPRTVMYGRQIHTFPSGAGGRLESSMSANLQIESWRCCFDLPYELFCDSLKLLGMEFTLAGVASEAPLPLQLQKGPEGDFWPFPILKINLPFLCLPDD